MNDQQANGNQRFSADRRLLTAADFSHVFKKPKKSADRYFMLLATPGQQQRPRMGLAIAKKRIKRAVDRNRIKRLVRESFRQHQNLPVIDIVVMANHSAKTASNAVLLQALEKHWHRLARLRFHSQTR